MRLSTVDLIQQIEGIISLQSDSVAKLVFQKKAETFLRDHICMQLDSWLEKQGIYHPTFVLREDKSFDIAIVSGEKKQRQRKWHYAPTALIELKYTNSYWILKKRDDEVDNPLEPQDNIWRQDMLFRKLKKAGVAPDLAKESGIKKDLEKLIDAQGHSPYNPSIHHILVLTNPHCVIENEDKYAYAVNSLGEINDCLRRYGSHEAVADEVQGVLTDQLNKISKSFLNNRKFDLHRLNPLTIGIAYESNIDLQIFVISEHGK